MDYNLTEEQSILKKTAGDFLKKECPKELVRELDESEKGYSPELWSKMAGLGWMGLMLPEQYGGSEFSFLDLTMLIEEMGYNICPGPFISTSILGGQPILTAGTEEQKQEILPKVATGEMILTMALTEPDAGFDAASIKAGAVLDNDEYVINGTKLFVYDANVADYLLCVARTSEESNPEKGVTIFLVKTG
ncbi:MAG: acyl-CoA dehydrogenase family protein, partial [Thermodesulfobacteriota bacterium]|nr:acyl-CoA dehydrogenase family protein [Thermodesulfobacteriota bacterium]